MAQRVYIVNCFKHEGNTDWAGTKVFNTIEDAFRFAYLRESFFCAYNNIDYFFHYTKEYYLERAIKNNGYLKGESFLMQPKDVC